MFLFFLGVLYCWVGVILCQACSLRHPEPALDRTPRTAGWRLCKAATSNTGGRRPSPRKTHIMVPLLCMAGGVRNSDDGTVTARQKGKMGSITGRQKKGKMERVTGIQKKE